MQEPILLIEDDRRLGAQVVHHLLEADFAPEWFTDGEPLSEGIPARFDLLILDLMLPGTSGLDILKRVRADSDIPVLVLSARCEMLDRVLAFKLGADDYLTKPYWPEELVERVRARVRRPVLHRGEFLELPPLRIDLHSRRVWRDGVEVTLTRVEFDLVALLARRSHTAVTRRVLVDQALDPERDGTERTLDVHIFNLRKKLGADVISTVWGIGYRLAVGGGG